MTSWKLVKQIVSRIGVRKLWRHESEDRWAVSLDNRTYSEFYQIGPAKVDGWLREFGVNREGTTV